MAEWRRRPPGLHAADVRLWGAGTSHDCQELPAASRQKGVQLPKAGPESAREWASNPGQAPASPEGRLRATTLEKLVGAPAPPEKGLRCIPLPTGKADQQVPGGRRGEAD